MMLADIYQLWNSAWPAGLTMLGLGSGFAVVLLIASQKLKVEVDPKVEQIHEALPNLDCGACGFAGCGQYAKAILQNVSQTPVATDLGPYFSYDFGRSRRSPTC